MQKLGIFGDTAPVPVRLPFIARLVVVLDVVFLR